ncbi:biopolymer transporter ExbB [Roseobacter sinensis]|uniref:Biopolymer transporter ExbB n=1 Tax=Roseobacter sinensis TaxID=2931391 RepID=A0ABT3BAM0_9RHOB|nr:biopolymer transporter ExbB [Roseobacter sp. WL0113]MCV3270626.1 biopolymer transporter ExbB [Roseobacter sp. WL0113]
MALPVRQARPVFSQPVRQISLMLIVLALSGFGSFLALPRVLPIFEANPYLNGFILFVFAIGVLACFYQVFQLIGSVRWIERFASDQLDRSTQAPLLLAPLATLLRSRGARMQVSATSTRSILDSVATRIDEAREITRYIVNTLIFLGLLGTFYGLATTVPAVVDTIRNLVPEDGEGGVEVFNRLMTGLEAQLGGMGVAFASSLLGLAGSLIVGLLELFAGHGQNRFYRELEEWLSTITRVGLTADDEAAGDQGALAAVVEHMVEQMERLQEMFQNSDVSRSEINENLSTLAGSIERMTQKMDGMDPASAALERVAAGQERLISALEHQGHSDGIDAESRMRLRSIDVQMLRILEEISAGRQESMAELRVDLSRLTEALRTAPPRATTRLTSEDG